jgi:hypothetical protein
VFGFGFIITVVLCFFWTILFVVVCDTTVLHYRQVVVVSCVALNFNDSFISWCCVMFYFSLFVFFTFSEMTFGGNAKFVAILIREQIHIRVKRFSDDVVVAICFRIFMFFLDHFMVWYG